MANENSILNNPGAKPNRYYSRFIASLNCALLCFLQIAITSSCSTPIRGAGKSGQAIAKLHYVSPRLLSSAEFRAAVGVPSTNAMAEEWRVVMKATNEAPPLSPQRKRAEQQEILTIAVLNGVLGNWFRIEELPASSNLLYCAFEDAWVAAHKAKTLHYKSRPIEIPGNSSYPSAHAVEAAVLSGVVEMLDAIHKAQVEELANEIGENRLILQRHFPADIQAGQHLGIWLLKKMTESQAFQNNLAAAQREIALRLQTTER